MIGIVDHGMGNIMSVFNAIDALGVEARICKKCEDLRKAERIILPGVGAFGDCMKNLKEKKFIEVLEDLVLKEQRPILGICLGMQVMARKGFENGEHTGLGWIDAEVVRLTPDDASLRIPHVGWNNINYRKESPLFQGLPLSSDFYFVHSYYMKVKNPELVDATCLYGGEVTAAIRMKNIYATQFHPEKSQEYGLKVLENFLSIGLS